jgi:isoleucyl-tRNA synthetase
MSDYKNTVALPQTTFPMRAVENEEGIREFWHLADTYGKMVSTPDQLDEGGMYRRFRLHDGPPYANGDIHMGHALNKILKDVVVRSQYIMGNAVSYVPGWDCHGLPIESQVEKNLIAEGRSKADLTTVEFRALCRDYAEEQVQKQMAQFKALGIGADWENRYETKSFSSEGKILRAFFDLLETDHVYSGQKPVMWSQVEGTSLAEAETNHKDIKTSQCWVRFPVQTYDDVSVLVWTTTPWTLPANRALAYNSDMTYVILKVISTTNPLVVVDEKLIMAESRVQATCETLGITEWSIEGKAGAEYLLCYHPLSNVGYGGGRQFMNASFVTDDVGTGIVHIAPEHGPEDYKLWMDYDMGDQEFESVLDDECRYKPEVPLFAGEQILNPTPKGEYIFEFTNAKVLKALEEQGALAFTSKQVQSLPHSWRSHTPLIYRATPQWFLDINTPKHKGPRGSLATSVKLDVIDASKHVKFIPEQGRNRFEAAVGGRPDWLVSRQRVWGTPMCLFVHKETGEVLKDEDINEFIVEQVTNQGGDVWWTRPKSFWFDECNDSLNPDDFDQVFDVLDVWFDSGCTYDLVKELGPNNRADLYLEGSDQHRGWFQSSALVGMARDSSLPFKAILTHGFVLDHKGEKMSKSKGNVVDPREKAEQFGTDVLRYWVASNDYTTDMRVGDEILKTAQEAYRKVRNTFRYLMSVAESNPRVISSEELMTNLSPLDHHMMNRMAEVRDGVVAAYKGYDFKEAVRLLADFMGKDLSAFYFDVNKDVLYCDALDSTRREAYVWNLWRLMHDLMVLWSPIIPHTIEEMGQRLITGKSTLLYVSMNITARVHEAEVDWLKVQEVIEAVNLAVEAERKNGGVQNLLDMNIEVWASPDHKIAFEHLDVAQILRCSQAAVYFTTADPGITVEIKRAEGSKCARSRLVLPEVGTDAEYPDLTLRDADAVRKWKSANV